MPEIIPLAFAAAVYPPLLAGIIILLARDKPVAMLAAFMAGGMLVTFVLGLLIVFVLHQRILERERGVVRAAKKPKDGPSRTQVMLNEGTPWAAFAAGLILNLPGIWYLDALKDIAQSNPSTATVVVDILVFIVIMFVLAELPLIGYMVAPEATQLRVASFQAWMSRNGRTVGMWAAALIGLYLLIKGIVNAV